MPRPKLDAVRAYWDASARRDYEAAGRCIGEGYVWIDHSEEVEARTPDQLHQAMQEDAAWRDRRFVIEQALETADGALVVQATVTGTLDGQWRSIEAHGRRVSRALCTIFRFDDEGRIIFEECYTDALTVMVQLGAFRARDETPLGSRHDRDG
jgi:ketosteroid isomerase-like protein